MNVLMTGAAGFIGSHLAESLISDGHRVIGVDDLSTGRRESFPGGLFVFDIADRHRLYELANSVAPDLVVHCAASYSNPNMWHRDTDTNVTGTINTTLVAKHHGAKLVYFQTALPPISSYAITKIAGEQFIGLSGVPALVFRLANMFGPRNVSGPIPAFYKRLAAGEICTVVNTYRDMVFVDDLVRGVRLALDAGVTGRFDMCSGREVAIDTLYRAVAAELAVGYPPERAEPGDDDVTSMVLDPGPAWAAFGWSPETDLFEGIARAVRWYREHGVDRTFTHLKVAA